MEMGFGQFLAMSKAAATVQNEKSLAMLALLRGAQITDPKAYKEFLEIFQED